MFVTIPGKSWQPLSKNRQNWNLHISKIGYRLYFLFVSEPIGVDSTTFPTAHKIWWISVKNCGRNRSTPDLSTDTRTHTHTHTPKWLDSLSSALDSQQALLCSILLWSIQCDSDRPIRLLRSTKPSDSRSTDSVCLLSPKRDSPTRQIFPRMSHDGARLRRDVIAGRSNEALC